MTELDTLRVWLSNNRCDGKPRFVNNYTIQFDMFGQTWEACGTNGGGIALGKMGVYVIVGSTWKDIADYLVKYSLSTEYQLKRIADALSDIKGGGISVSTYAVDNRYGF